MPLARAAAAAAVLVVLFASLVGCAEQDGSADDAAARTAGFDTAEGRADDGGTANEALEGLAELMIGAGGVQELGGSLNEALHARFSVLDDCENDEACFVEHRRSAGPPAEVRVMLEAYVDRVFQVWQEVARVVGDALDDGAVVAVESAQQWYEAAVLSARTAMATVECLHEAATEQLSRWRERCTYQRDLYAAAVHDQNRLRQEFEQAYSAFVGSAGTGQGV